MREDIMPCPSSRQFVTAWIVSHSTFWTGASKNDDKRFFRPSTTSLLQICIVCERRMNAPIPRAKQLESVFFCLGVLWGIKLIDTGVKIEERMSV